MNISNKSSNELAYDFLEGKTVTLREIEIQVGLERFNQNVEFYSLGYFWFKFPVSVCLIAFTLIS